MLLDGVGADALADALVPGLTAAGRPPLRVRADHFLRPAGERFEHGREDPEAFRTTWLDDGALAREVLDAASTGTWLPALRDPVTDRSARAARQPVPERAVLLVDGVLLLGRGLPADLVVHVALSPAALARRGVPDWQREAFADYERDVQPRRACDVLVLAEDPRRPAVQVRPTA
ncbi:MAG TPA: uridine kinase [Mycobacteriales bacterium]|nr:uridine kinase [Mycobacteriales bacterium]